MQTIHQVNGPVNVKVLRDFFFKAEDAKKSDRPRRVTQGSDLTLSVAEFKVLYMVNRVCLPNEFVERVKQYPKLDKSGKGR